MQPDTKKFPLNKRERRKLYELNCQENERKLLRKVVLDNYIITIL